MVRASTMVSTAIMDPGLRSIPPVMITIVAPRATTLSTATCRAMLRKFSALKKEGVVTATTTTMMRSAATGPANSVMLKRFMLIGFRDGGWTGGGLPGSR